MKTQLFILLLLLSAAGLIRGQGYGEIRGIVKTTELEPVPFALIRVLQDAQLVSGAQADENGKYSVKPLQPGTYDIIVSATGYISQPVQKIRVSISHTEYVDVKLAVNTLTTVEVLAAPLEYTAPIVDPTMFTFKTIDSKELDKQAGYIPGNIGSVLDQLSSEIVVTGNGYHFRGGRDGASGFYVDGTKTIGEARVPGVAIEQITVFTGGVPAMYGDMTSGAIMITTMSYFNGIREKNMRISAIREEAREEKKKKELEAAEKARQEEIEAEKKKEQEEKKTTDEQ